MGWVWIVAAGWVLLGIGVAVLIARSVGMADHKAAEEKAGFADEPNIVVDPAPLHLAPEPPAPVEPVAAAEPASPGRSVRDAPTIPGLPSARPSVGRPPVPHSAPQVPERRSGLG